MTIASNAARADTHVTLVTCTLGEVGEVLVPDRLLAREPLSAALADWNEILTPLPSARFDSDNARKRLLAAFNAAALESFGPFSRAEVAACGALLDYVELTQAGRSPVPSTRPSS